MYWRIDTSLADQEVMVDDGNMVLGKLDIELDILSTQIGGCNERGKSVLSKLQRPIRCDVLPQSAMTDEHSRLKFLPVRLSRRNLHVGMVKWRDYQKVEVDHADYIKTARHDGNADITLQIHALHPDRGLDRR